MKHLSLSHETLSPSAGLDDPCQFSIVGKPVCVVFGKQDVAVPPDIEDSTRPFDQLDFLTRNFLDLGRDTRGMRFVVSHGAVNDFPIHVMSPTF
jgi:hypothetical protein